MISVCVEVSVSGFCFVVVRVAYLRCAVVVEGKERREGR